MQQVMDEALQQLYWACRRKFGFPGEIPDESTGVITTDAILKGLGFMVPNNPDPLETCHHSCTPPIKRDSARSIHTASSSSFLLISPPEYGRRPSRSPSGTFPIPCEENLNTDTNTPRSGGELHQALIRDLNTLSNRAQNATGICYHGGMVFPHLQMRMHRYVRSHTQLPLGSSQPIISPG